MLPDVLGPVVGTLVARAGVLLDLPPPDHSPAEAREAADQVLQRSEYQWEQGESLIERVVEWIAERFADLLEPLGFGAGGLPVWIGWLVLAGLGALVGFLVFRARGGWSRSAAPRVEKGSRIVLTEGEVDLDWAAEVDRCEREGRWRDALRARYRVLVGELASRGLIGDLVGRTTGELLAEVRQTVPAAGPPFAAATELFEETWYGGATVGPADRDRFVGLAAEVGSRAARTGSAARSR